MASRFVVAGSVRERRGAAGGSGRTGTGSGDAPAPPHPRPGPDVRPAGPADARDGCPPEAREKIEKMKRKRRAEPALAAPAAARGAAGMEPGQVLRRWAGAAGSQTLLETSACPWKEPRSCLWAVVKRLWGAKLSVSSGFPSQL